MKPTVRIAAARTPDGGEMELYRHDGDFVIKIDGKPLMNSRRHGSECELARLACGHLTGTREPRVLIGGLGMGYTLRQALDMLGPHGKAVVCELVGAVGEWNRDHLGELNGRALADGRVDLRIGDVVELILRSGSSFDAILLDIDNGPKAMTRSGNSRLYRREGIMACRRALRKPGSLGVWSAVPSREFEGLLMDCGFHVRRFRVPAYRGSKSGSCFVFVASEDRKTLPPGGGEPYRPGRKGTKRSRRR